MEQSEEHKTLLNVLGDGILQFRQERRLNAFAVAMADDILETIRKGCFDKIVVENLPKGATIVRLYCYGFFEDYFAEYDKDGEVTRLGAEHTDDDSLFELIEEYEKRGVL